MQDSKSPKDYQLPSENVLKVHEDSVDYKQDILYEIMSWPNSQISLKEKMLLYYIIRESEKSSMGKCIQWNAWFCDRLGYSQKSDKRISEGLSSLFEKRFINLYEHKDGEQVIQRDSWPTSRVLKLLSTPSAYVGTTPSAHIGTVYTPKGVVVPNVKKNVVVKSRKGRNKNSQGKPTFGQIA